METNFKGSVYHPNLVTFEIALENGLRQSGEKQPPALTGQFKNSSLNQFHVLSSFLRQKPYAFSLSADKSRTVENREFFERQVVDSAGYAGNFGWRNKFIPLGFSFSNSSKVIDRVLRPSQELTDKELNLSLNNDSEALGETTFSFIQDEFSRLESGTPDQKGTSRDFNLSNRKFLSDERTKLLGSQIHFYHSAGTAQNAILSVNENLNLEHSDSLSSFYNYSFSDKNSSGQKVKDNKVSANVRHKLYESLTSSFGGFYFKSDAVSSSQESYGLSWDEDYLKRLGKIGRISSGIGLSYAQEERNASGSALSVIDESQTLSLGTLSFLVNPRVDTATVLVTDLAQTTTFTVNVDYQLSGVGELTRIQRLPAGSIAEGQEVLVDYQARSSPFFKFNTFSEQVRFRMDFLDNFIGVFYRLSRESHPRTSGRENATLQTLMDTLVGADLRYKNFEMALEAQDYDSNLSPYRRLRLKELLTFHPGKKSTLTFASSQSRIRLIDTQETQVFFDAVSRYSLPLSQYARFSLELGFRRQTGSGVDLDETSSGCAYELNYGKFLMQITYDLKRQLFLGDRLLNHFFSMKVRRRF